ncbi:MAG: winged helix-turn-helix transcriptional regulator [Methanobacteriota archaeon]
MNAGWKGLLAAAVAAVLVTGALLVYAIAEGNNATTGGMGGYDGSPDSELCDLGGGAPEYGSLFLDELNAARDADGSWSGDPNATALSVYANAVGDNATLDSLNWTMEHYDVSNDTAVSYAVLAEAPSYADGQTAGISLDYADFKLRAASDLSGLQDANGSWGGEVSSTALATYALATEYGSGNETAAMGAQWLAGEEPQTVEESAKTAMAMEATGNSPAEYVESIAANQSSDGSFGSFSDTAWAVMALAETGEYSDLLKARDGLIWLREQAPPTDEELALGALAEQYYFAAASRAAPSAAGAQSLVLVPWKYALGGLVLASLGLTGVLFSRLRDDEVMDGVRRQIYDHIQSNPGEHVAEITRRLSLSSSSARYHLLVLECNEKVIAHKSGKLKHYYSSHNGYGIYTNGFEYKDVLASLKNETARKMVKFILSRGGANQKAIAEHLGMHPSTVVWHARRLRAAHVIVRERRGKEILYSANGEIEVAKVLDVLDSATF